MKNEMGEAYPELRSRRDAVGGFVRSEGTFDAAPEGCLFAARGRVDAPRRHQIARRRGFRLSIALIGVPLRT